MKYTFLAGLLVSLPLSVHAQEPEQTSDDTRTFTIADFEQFAPRSALDMVRQIPGFSISQSDGQRGFGQAQENVLINGQRISSKSTGVREVLSRIPATNVEQIELVEGASLDIPGLSGQVANVIATANGISGTWTYRQRYRENLPPALDWFEVSVNGQNGALGWTLGVETEPNRGASAGREDVFENFSNGVGELVRYREEEFTFIADFVNLNGSLNWKPANGHIANLNAEYNLWEPDQRETTSTFSPDGTLLSQSVFQFKENEWNSEISGDYELDLGPGRFKLIGLQRNEHSPTRAKFFGANIDGTELVNQIADSTTDESESILRGEYNLTGANNSDWQFSLEGAFNSLENEQQRFRGDTFDSVTEIPGNPGVRVEEKRAEAFITHGRQLTKDLRLQASLGAEQSEIMSESVDVTQTRTFTRPKGSASLAWTVNDKTNINASIERQVGQLNFFDFVSNVDLNRGDDNTGNVDIVPDQRWRLGVEVERDFGSWGAVTAEVFGEQIEDLIDLVPIFDQGTPPRPIGEGPGNIDDASRYGIEIDGTFKFDNLGWKGAQLEYEVFAQDTFLDDPLTGETRDFNGRTIYFYELNFRHDIPNTDWAWGLNYEKFEEAPVFRRDARRFFIQPQGFSWAFIEHKDIFGMTGSIFYANLLDSDDDFQRIQYAPDRNGQIVQIEDRSRNFGGILTLRLQGSF